MKICSFIKSRMVLVILLTGLCASPVAASSQNTVILTDSQNRYPIGNNLAYLEDVINSLTINDIASKKYFNSFTVSNNEIPYFGMKKSSYWLRFNVIDQSSANNTWVLEFAYQFYNNIDMYVKTHKGLRKYKSSGFHIAGDNREIKYRNYAFNLSLSKNTVHTFYLKITTQVMVIPLYIRSHTNLINKIQKEYIFLGLYYGIIAVMILYNFFIFISIRDRSYLFYVFYSSCFMVWQFAYNGLGHTFLWPHNPNFNFLANIMSPVILFFILFFAENFLSVKAKIPSLEKIYFFLKAFAVIEFLLFLLFIAFYIENNLFNNILTTMANILNAVVTLLVIASSIISLKSGFRPAKYFLIAWALFSVGMVTFNLMMLHILPFNFMTQNSIQVGSALEIILFSFALADRISILKKEKIAAQERYRILIETIPYGIIENDKAGIITYANPSFNRLVKYNNGPIAGTSVFNLLADDDERIKFGNILLHALNGALKPGSYTTRFAAGRQIDVLVDWNYKLNNNKIITGIISIITDITEKKNIEIERKKLQKQLQRAQKMDALGTLAGGIAHDFNNILMSVMGNISLIMLEINKTDEHFENIKNIEEAVKSGSNLIKQFLIFAKGDNFSTEPSDINEIITKTTRLISKTMKNINFHLHLNPAIWTVEVDKGQIEQVLINLYVNACQAMPNGGDLHIHTENSQLDNNFTTPLNMSSGDFIKISVIDSGVGMDEKIIDRIFDPFFTTKELGIGTGLGLSSAYGIIQKHKGFIDVYSKKGQGSTFTIFIPSTTKKIIKKQIPNDEIKRGSETILIVDDEQMIRSIGEKLLHKLGYTVLTADGGARALILYKQHISEIRLVILDLIMSGMNGEETFYQLKELDPSVKVLLSTGYSLENQAAQLLADGCKGYIQKPFNIVDLSHIIREIIEG